MRHLSVMLNENSSNCWKLYINIDNQQPSFSKLTVEGSTTSLYDVRSSEWKWGASFYEKMVI